MKWFLYYWWFNSWNRFFQIGKPGKKTKKKGSDSDSDEDWTKNKKTNNTRTGKKGPGKGKGGGGGGYTKAVTLSPQLAAFVGAEKMARHEVVKKIWGVIKERNLYVSSNEYWFILLLFLNRLFYLNFHSNFGIFVVTGSQKQTICNLWWRIIEGNRCEAFQNLWYDETSKKSFYWVKLNCSSCTLISGRIIYIIYIQGGAKIQIHPNKSRTSGVEWMFSFLFFLRINGVIKSTISLNLQKKTFIYLHPVETYYGATRLLPHPL